MTVHVIYRCNIADVWHIGKLPGRHLTKGQIRVEAVTFPALPEAKSALGRVDHFVFDSKAGPTPFEQEFLAMCESHESARRAQVNALRERMNALVLEIKKATDLQAKEVAYVDAHKRSNRSMSTTFRTREFRIGTRAKKINALHQALQILETRMQAIPKTSD